jgi:hypothetical protein
MLMMIDQDFGGPFSLAGWPLQGLSGRRKGDEIFFFHKLFVGIEEKKRQGKTNQGKEEFKRLNSSFFFKESERSAIAFTGA